METRGTLTCSSTSDTVGPERTCDGAADSTCSWCELRKRLPSAMTSLDATLSEIGMAFSVGAVASLAPDFSLTRFSSTSSTRANVSRASPPAAAAGVVTASGTAGIGCGVCCGVGDVTRRVGWPPVDPDAEPSSECALAGGDKSGKAELCASGDRVPEGEGALEDERSIWRC